MVKMLLLLSKAIEEDGKYGNKVEKCSDELMSIYDKHIAAQWWSRGACAYI